MACTSNKFVINKSMSNEFILTIKQNDSTLPMIIDELNDTFVVKVYKLDTDVLEFETTATIYDAPNGQILITFTVGQVGNLVVERGSKADRYYLRPTYRLAIDCNTTNNGNFVAKVNEVYVEA